MSAPTTMRQPFLPADDRQEVQSFTQYQVYVGRWWVLTIFFLLSALNTATCFSFVPISAQAGIFYEANLLQTSVFVGCFLLVYLLTAIPTSVFIDRQGVRTAVLLAAWLQAMGAVLRYSPEMLWHSLKPQEWYWISVAGQTLSACSHAVFSHSPPLLATIWFSADERDTAASVGNLAYLLGLAVAFGTSPLCSTHAATGCDMSSLLGTYAAASCALTFIVTVGFTPWPPSPPSLIAYYKLREWGYPWQADNQQTEMGEALSQNMKRSIQSLLPFSHGNGHSANAQNRTCLSSIRKETRILIRIASELGFIYCCMAFALGESCWIIYVASLHTQLRQLDAMTGNRSSGLMPRIILMGRSIAASSLVSCDTGARQTSKAYFSLAPTS
eukprot:g72950.t1